MASGSALFRGSLVGPAISDPFLTRAGNPRDGIAGEDKARYEAIRDVKLAKHRSLWQKDPSHPITSAQLVLSKAELDAAIAALPVASPDTKVCPICGETKAVNEFFRNATKSDGLQSCCVACTQQRLADVTRERGPILGDGDGEKACTCCGVTKPYGEFDRQPGRRDGRDGRCKVCRREARLRAHERTAERLAEPPPPEGHRRCTGCRQALPVGEFYLRKRSPSGYRSRCRTCENDQKRRTRTACRELLAERKRTSHEVWRDRVTYEVAAFYAGRGYGIPLACERGGLAAAIQAVRARAAETGSEIHVREVTYRMLPEGEWA